MKKQTLSFEEALINLEAIVDRMEQSEQTLAELMDSYSQGIALSEICMKSLARAEAAMDILVQEKGKGFEEQPLKIEDK